MYFLFRMVVVSPFGTPDGWGMGTTHHFRFHCWAEEEMKDQTGDRTLDMRKKVDRVISTPEG